MSKFTTEVDEEEEEMPVDMGFFANVTIPAPEAMETEMEEEDPLADVTSRNEEDDVDIVTSALEVQVACQENDKLMPYRLMGFKGFQEEMDKSVGEIVRESLAIFARDPREYHPFYLRVWKYLLIGKNLGYVGGLEGEEAIWRKYDQFAKAQLELLKKGTDMRLLAKRTPYATYISTRKLVINGQKVKLPKIGDYERRKMYKPLEELMDRLRKEWNEGDHDEGIREDLETRLKFFKECQAVTHPSEVIKMNNLWKKLVDEKGLKLKPRMKEVIKEEPREIDEEGEKIMVKVIMASTPSSPPSSSTPPPDNLTVSEKSGSNEKKSLRKPLRKLRKLKQTKPTLLKRGIPLKRKLKLIKSSVAKHPARDTATKPILTPLKSKLEKLIANKLKLPSKKLTNGKLMKMKSVSKPENAQHKKTLKTYSKQVVVKPEVTPQEVKAIPSKKPPTHVPSQPVVKPVEKRSKPENSNPKDMKARKHNPDNPVFYCPVLECAKGPLKTARHLWTHYARYHINLQELCPVAAELATILKTSESNQRNPAPEPKFVGGTCEYCGKFIQTQLIRHIRTQHGTEQREQKQTCPYCQKTFKEKCAMTAHIKRFHTGTEIIRCSVCGRSCATKGKLWKHRVEEHGLSPEEEAMSLGVQYEPCQFCGEQLQKGKALRVHVEGRHPEEFDLWWQQELVRRREHKLAQKKIQGKKARERENEQRKRKREMKKGEEVPSGNEIEGEWTCPKDKCQHKFTTQRSMFIHLLQVHCNFEERLFTEKLMKFEEKIGAHCKFLCTFCGAHVYGRMEVRVHIASKHHDIYQCLVNNSPFPKPDLKCAHCSTGGFTEDEELREHVERCHGELCWRCPECDKVMLSPEEMTEHFEKDHGDGGDGGDELGEKWRLGRALWGCNPISNGLLTEEERLEFNERKKEVYAKYRKMNSNCLICGEKRAFSWMRAHLKQAHELVEDGDLWKCGLCDKEVFGSRVYWLGHLELWHGNKVNMQEMVERAKQINTKEDWRQMEVKTIKRYGNRHKIYKKVISGPIDQADDITEKKMKVKKTKKGTRNGITTKSGRKVNRKKLWEPEITERKARKPRSCVLRNNLEREKRLVILVERLTKEEILKWKHRILK